MSYDTSSVTGGAMMQADLQGLDQLRRAAREESPEALRVAARQFEALFINMMLKNVRETGFGDELFGSDQEKLYQGMFDQQLSQHMAHGGGIGLADLLVRQLGGQAEGQLGGQQNAQPGGGAAPAAVYAGIERTADEEG